MQDKTKQALARIAAGERPYAVAKDMGMSPNTLYVARARERIRAEGRCECCGQPLLKKGGEMAGRGISDKATRLTKKPRDVIDVSLALGGYAVATLERVAEEERLTMDELIVRIVSDWAYDETLEGDLGM